MREDLEVLLDLLLERDSILLLLLEALDQCCQISHDLIAVQVFAHLIVQGGRTSLALVPLLLVGIGCARIANLIKLFFQLTHPGSELDVLCFDPVELLLGLTCH